MVVIHLTENCLVTSSLEEGYYLLILSLEEGYCLLSESLEEGYCLLIVIFLSSAVYRKCRTSQLDHNQEELVVHWAAHSDPLD